MQMAQGREYIRFLSLSPYRRKTFALTLTTHCSPYLSLAIEFCNLSQLGVREIYLVYAPFV